MIPRLVDNLLFDIDIPTEILVSGFEEPVEKWENSNDGANPTLKDVYNNPNDPEIQLGFQLRVMNTLIERELSMQKMTGIVIEERSLYHSKSFIHQLIDKESIGAVCGLQLAKTLDLMCEMTTKPMINIFLTADYDTLLDRIKNRGRDGEENITKEMLKEHYRNKVIHPSAQISIEIDTTNMGIKEVVREMSQVIKNHLETQDVWAKM